jgi:hypothetical protein
MNEPLILTNTESWWWQFKNTRNLPESVQDVALHQ